jgi:hypothetical protein
MKSSRGGQSGDHLRDPVKRRRQNVIARLLFFTFRRAARNDFLLAYLCRASSGDRHDRRRRRTSHAWAAHFRRPRNRGSETLESARSDRRKMRSRGILSHAGRNLGSNRRAAAHLPLDRIRRRLSGRCVGRLIRGIPVTERPGGSSSRTWLKRTIARFLSRSPLCIDAMTMHFSVGGAPRCRRERSVGRCRTRRGRRGERH